MKQSTLYFWGVLLILFGLELHSVETFYLTPAIASAIGENVGGPSTKAKLAIQRSFQAIVHEKTFEVPPYPWTPQHWLGWPLLCCGIIFIVQGSNKGK